MLIRKRCLAKFLVSCLDLRLESLVLPYAVEPGIFRCIKFVRRHAEPLVIIKSVVEVPHCQLKFSRKILIHVGREVAGVGIHGKFIKYEIIHPVVDIYVALVSALAVPEVGAVKGFLESGNILDDIFLLRSCYVLRRWICKV